MKVRKGGGTVSIKHCFKIPCHLDRKLVKVLE